MPDRGGGLVPGDIRRANENAARGFTYDRAGDIIFADYFQNGIAHWVAALGGSVNELSKLQPEGGREFCYHMQAAAGLASGMSVYIPLPPAITMGIELGFKFTGPNVSYVEAQMIAYDGTNSTNWLIRVDVANSNLRYMNSAGAITTQVAFTALDPTTVSPFHTVKFTANRSTANYGRALFDGLAPQDLSAQSGRVSASANAPAVLLRATLAAGGGGAADVYVTRVIQTQNEI